MASPTLKLTIVLLAMVTVGASASVPSIPDEMKPFVKDFYFQSPNTPLHLLFESYLQTIQGLSEAGELEVMDYVVDTLHMGHSPAGEARALEIAHIMRAALNTLNRENLDKREKLLCSVDPYSRSTRDIVHVLNAIDKVGELIAKKQLRLTSGQLVGNERRRLHEQLKAMRDGFFYMSFDYKFLLEDSSISPQQRLADVCAKLETSKYYFE